ncbi:alpha/beta-hydrolase [Sarocladium strictum]
MFPYRVGVPLDTTSGLEKWEGHDPAEWVIRGYATVNIDARGAYYSEGNAYVYGTQEGRDGHDSIEWIGTQPWCNGNVGMTGNSWLGTTQWFIAAQQPPHLKAMAPWEGLGDYYRDSICRGGIPDYSFWGLLLNMFAGKNRREDVETMVDKYPLWNAYWEDKKPKLHQIITPMYACASYSSGLHTEGSMRGFLLSASKEKWLRFHSTQEWHDLYQADNTDDLQRFFDHYLKNEDNGWESTPQIRLSLLGFNRPTVVNRPVAAYPPPEFEFKQFYLDASAANLSQQPVIQDSSVDYDAEFANAEEAGSHFTYTFDQYTELCGFSKVKLFMSTPDHDDMDVYVIIRKLDAKGQALEHLNVPKKDWPAGMTGKDQPYYIFYRYMGPNGRLRASHRATKPEPGYSEEKRTLMSEAYIYHPHDHEEKLDKNQIVELNITIWPGGMIFDKGESMRLEIKGVPTIRPEFEGQVERMKNYNIGRHIIHTGGQHQSALYVPLSTQSRTDS